MTTIDSNGIIRYEDSDGAPTPPVLNLGMQSVSDALSPYIKRVKWLGTGPSRTVELWTDDDATSGARIRLRANGRIDIIPEGSTSGRYIPFATQTREYNTSFTARNSYTISFNFQENLFTKPPVVMTNIATGNGAAVGWISRAVQITTTGFTFYLAKVTAGTNAWDSLPVQWTATQMEP